MNRYHAILSVLVGAAILCIFVMAYLWAALPAHAHSWYDYQCCSDRDCEPIEPDAVNETEAGYEVNYFSKQGFQVHGFVPRDKARHSQDGRFHGCAMPSRFLCLYVPIVS
jgi:hypothetical protein